MPSKDSQAHKDAKRRWYLKNRELTKKIVYYSVTVGANSKAEAKRIASDFDHCQHYEVVEYCDGYEYKVGKMLETTDEKWLT